MSDKKKEEAASGEDFASEPIASRLIVSGEFDQPAFQAAYGKGSSDEEKVFAFRFVYSLNSRTVAAFEAAARAIKNPMEDPGAMKALGAGGAPAC